MQSKNLSYQRSLEMIRTVALDMISIKQKEKSDAVGTKVEDTRKERHLSSQETRVAMETHGAGNAAQKHKERENPGQGCGCAGFT